MRVKVVSSPYWAVKKGSLGRFLEIKNYCRHPFTLELPEGYESCCWDKNAIWLVELDNGSRWHFWPYEVEYVIIPGK